MSLVSQAALLASMAALLASAYLALRLRGAEEALRETRRILSYALEHQKSLRKLAKVRSKPRRRYVVFEYLGPLSSENRREVEDAIIAGFAKVFGDRGVELARPRLIMVDDESRCGVVRVRRNYVNHLIGVLGLVRSINGEKVMLI
ncbi:MAG: Rpp14/Pop5 family protein, partial [Candidatus Korarchaeota archaeon]|nr:Rpp14/Pop5 family protein [Candidatus Korarchaeota archaeon]